MNHIQKIVASLCLLSLTQVAAAHPANTGYLHDSQESIVRDGYSGCVRTSQWSADKALPECGAKPVAQAAPLAAAAPAPIPAQIATIAAPLMKIDLSADGSFDLNKAELSADAKAKLSELARQLKGLSYDHIAITGHADRTGSTAGNQKLSERRAIAAHNYLVSEGIPSAKILSSGMGSSQPATPPGACAKLRSKKLAACLAPDRRVEIRVTGTRSK